MAVSLSDFYNQVAERADTDKTQITVAETKRVLSEAFIVLHEMDTADCLDVVLKGLKNAQKKASK